MKKILVLITIIFYSSISLAANSDIDSKNYKICIKQMDFIYFSAIASTGRNIAISESEPAKPKYLSLGEDLLLSKKEIYGLIDAYAKDRMARVQAISYLNEENKRLEAIKCSQIPQHSLITYDRLKSKGLVN